MNTKSEMKQKELYFKDINRPIEGVIKANDDRHLLNELDEYVLTDELMGKANRNKMLPGLFADLGGKDFKSSVWISGYFGSGKSHLLKMLSLVLENKEIGDDKCADLFAKKVDDFEFEHNIKKAAKIPTQAILFNIAAKSDGVTSMGADTDPVLSIFLKVFNELLGYDPVYPEIAEIERHLDSIGQYTYFKSQYEKRFLKTWEAGRKAALLNQDEIADVFAEIKSITADDANRYIDNLINNYKLDINGFGDLILNYIQAQPPGFRLVFCVDEVGQFIAGNVRLMLSLQTIAETLSFKTDGQSFMIVTSQNDLNATIGDMNATQAHDFSRIQGRFEIKIPLTSANADEVIQKRLLLKNDQSGILLSGIYDKEQHNVKTLLTFGDSSRTYQKYRNSDHFVSTYPFIPYQFDLFQASIRALSDHNAFIGSQQSVGERSMLGVFQQVAKSYAEKDISFLVSFAHMYEGIKDVLQSKIQSDILQAGRSVDSELAKDILKALFLVKYIKGFHASLGNIAILLLPKFDVDIAAFHVKIQEALNLLENETYIQRTAGNFYEYLTNQEKDIEDEIKSTEIDPSAVGELLSGYLFDDILRDSKVKLDNNNQPYEFGKKLDDRILIREKDFYVNFITPLNSNSVSTSNVSMFSIGRPNDLVIFLKEDSRLIADLKLIRKTEIYLQTTDGSDTVKSRILSEKAQQNHDRKRAIVNQLREYIGEAKMYLNGSELADITTKDPRTKITQGVQQLIKTIFTSLKMLTVDFTEAHLTKIIQSQDDVLFQTALHEIELEVLSRVQRNKVNHERTTIKSLLDTFGARPYGWYQVAVLCIIAKLFKRNKISLKLDGNILDDRSVLAALQRNNQYSSTIIDLEEEIQSSQIKKVKDFYQEYFHEPNLGNEPKEVSRLFKQRLKTEIDDLNIYFLQRNRLKFLEALDEPLRRLKHVWEKDHPYFFIAFDQYEDELLNDKENVLDDVKKFMKGPQFAIFETLMKYLEGNNANFDYISGDDIGKLRMVAESAVPYKGAMMQEAKATLDSIQKEVSEQQITERATAVLAISESIKKLKSFADFEKLDSRQQLEILADFEAGLSEIEKERYIGNIRNKAYRITTDVYQKQLDRMTRLANPPKPVSLSGSAVPEPVVPRIVYIRKENVKITFSKHALENRQDVEAYLTALKEQYYRIIDEDKRIAL
ncbi:BREX system P-loop protein BrxC [Dyadobacter sp. 3J3]|uniref:BREX system P-loop protein BrxC n=1 Tax=Dyadobacter sp. 3J3 TaxID=2606600 RepID=UPI00135CE96E|nr:BREX system P-loop protein BrxC [Dyadobacter sp. 3J3]